MDVINYAVEHRAHAEHVLHVEVVPVGSTTSTSSGEIVLAAFNDL